MRHFDKLTFWFASDQRGEDLWSNLTFPILLGVYLYLPGGDT